MPLINNFRQWRNGEVFNASNYVYERNTIVNELNRITTLLSSEGDITFNSATMSELTLNGVTITSFNDVIEGNETFLQSDPPEGAGNGDLWFQTEE